jgi:adenylate cyclase
MKPVSTIRNAFAMMLFTAAGSFASFVSLANRHDLSGNHKSASTAEVKYINGKEGEGIFDVVYDNTAGSRFSLQILDEAGAQLYQNIYSDKKFEKKFKLADPETFSRLVFIIRNLEDHSIQRFEVEASTRLVQKVDVKEVK